MIVHIQRNPHIWKGYRLQKVNHIECTSITAKIISRKYTCKELLRKSAFLVRKKIEALLLYCFLSCNFFFLSNIKISHEHKVYLNIKMNLTSKLNISVIFSVTLGLYCFCKNVEFLVKCLTNLLAVLL